LFGQIEAREEIAREGESPAGGPLEFLRGQYREDAEKYVFHADAERKMEFKLIDKPIMRWATDNDWSGDIFVWTFDGRPGVVGCMLSGPSGETNRLAFHEFHLLDEKPIAPAELQTHRQWKPEKGLPRMAIEGAPPPAATASRRLAQMRQMAREFTAHLQAESDWELRLLPQPLFRYGEPEEGDKAYVVDGALFTWIWSRGIDPEVILLLECRRTDEGLAWHYAPVRFSNRPVWLKLGDKEVWRVDSHNEPAGGVTSDIYTTAYARTFPADSKPESP
jgi:hypothetical protein